MNPQECSQLRNQASTNLYFRGHSARVTTISTLNSSNKMVFIHLYLNSTVVGIATSPKNRDQDWFSFVEATLKLKRGDIIYLKPTDFFQLIVTSDGKNFDNQFCVSFSGSLMTEVDD